MSGRSWRGAVALITGANKGIGRAAAEQLAAMGLTVLIGSRDQRRGERAANEVRSTGGQAVPVVLDVTERSSIEDAAIRVREDFGHLDVLVNNAGITGSGRVSPEEVRDQVPSSVDLDMVRSVFDTNVFGVMAVTNAFVPLLRQSPSGRIVNVSSTLGSLTLASDPASPLAALPPAVAYATSKTALNALTLHYARELRPDRIWVNAADPGFVDTDINNHTGHLSPAEGAAIVVRLGTLGPDGPTGGFFGESGSRPW